MKIIYSLFLLYTGLLVGSCNGGDKENPPKEKPIPLAKSISLFNDSILHEIRISVEPSFWDSITFHKKLRDEREISKYLMCNVSLDGNLLDSCGFRAKGESSYEFYPGKKKSLKISFNKYKKQSFQSVRQLNLNNAFKDPTFMREKLMLDFIKKEGLPAPRSSYAKVFINNEYWGLYLLVEEIDREFVKRTFANDSIGNLYKGEPYPTLAYEGTDTLVYYRKYMKKTNEKKGGWSDLVSFVKAANEEKPEADYNASLEKHLNVQDVLKIWAINNLFVNIDAYNLYFNHNFFIYNNPSSQKFEWINYDYNYGFGAWTPNLNYRNLVNLDVFFLPPNKKQAPLVYHLLEKNSSYRKYYLNYMKSLLAGNFKKEYFQKEIARHSKLISAAVKEDKLKMFSYDDYVNNQKKTLGDITDPGAFIPGLAEFVRDRSASVNSQLVRKRVVNTAVITMK